MKKTLFLPMTLATLVFSASGVTSAKNFNSYQTKTMTSQKQTDAEKKEAREKRAAAKKEAEQKRKEAKSAAREAKNTTKKKHKKFLGIF